MMPRLRRFSIRGPSMSDIVLSPGVRQNRLALQSTAQMMGVTQNRLATGKKVNSALDNPTNFFISQGLNSRANDLSALLDSIGQAQKTLEATDQGLTSLTKLVESAKSVAKQARHDPRPAAITHSPPPASLQDLIAPGGGAAGSSPLTGAVNGGANQVITFGTAVGQVSTLAEFNTALGGLTGVTASATGTGNRTLSFSVASSSTANSLALTGSTGVDTTLNTTNGTTTGVASTSTPNATRTSLQTDYNSILTQIDQLAPDPSYNGINLLNGDDLKVVFNESGSSFLTVTGVSDDST